MPEIPWDVLIEKFGGFFLIPLIFYLCYYNKREDIKSQGLETLRERLETDSLLWEIRPHAIYFNLLQRFLAWTEKPGIFGKDYSFRNATGYSTALKLAIAYPAALVLLNWVITGVNTSGISGLLPEHLAAWRRILTLLLLVLSLTTATKYFFAETSWKSIFLFFLTFVSSLGVTMASAYTVTSSMAYLGSTACIIFGSIVLIAAASIGEGATAITFVLLMPAIASFAVIIPGISTTVKMTIMTVGTFIGSMYLHNNISALKEKKNFYIFFIPLTFFTMFALSWFIGKHHLTNSGVFPLLVFLAFLPMVNSIFDFLAYTLTRRFLQRILTEKTMTEALWGWMKGFMLALLLMIGLTGSCIAGLGFMNYISGTTFFNLDTTWQVLRKNPRDPSIAWIYFTLFSTMIPTFIHTGIALFSFFSWRTPEFIRDWLKTHLSDPALADNPVKIKEIAIALVLRDAVLVICLLIPIVVFATGMYELTEYLLPHTATVPHQQEQT